MPLTSPDNIFYADGSTPLSAEAISAAEANSIQEALTSTRAIRSYRWDDVSARNNQIDMVAGDVGYQIDTQAEYRYSGTQWLDQKVSMAQRNATANAVTSAFSVINYGAAITPVVVVGDITVASSTASVTINRPGTYRFFGYAAFNATTSGTKALQVTKNAVISESAVLVTGVLSTISITAFANCITGDVVDMRGFANVSTALGASGGYGVGFSVDLVGY